MKRLPAHEVKIQEFTYGGEIVDIARHEVSADSSRSERDEHVEMNLSGFVNIESLGRDQPVDYASRLNPLCFIWGDDAEVFRQIVDKPFHFSGSSAPRQFRQHHGAQTNHEFKIQDFLFKAPGSQVVDVDRCVENGEISCGRSHRALPCRCIV